MLTAVTGVGLASMRFYWSILAFLTINSAHAEIKKLEGFVRQRGSEYILDVETPLADRAEYKLRAKNKSHAKLKDLFVAVKGDVNFCGRNKCLSVTEMKPTFYNPLKARNLEIPKGHRPKRQKK